MGAKGLTPSQEDLFRTLEMLDHDGKLRDSIEHVKEDTRRDNVIRGFTRVKGFTPNKK